MPGHNEIVSGSRRSTVDYHHFIQADRIHGSLYTRADVFDEEIEKIFYGSWVFIGHDSEIPERGDYVCRTIGRESLVMLRNGNDQINVLINRCAHRGNMICVAEKGNAKFIKCLYHGWVYSLDGELLDMPGPQGYQKEKSDFRLGTLKTENYRGFVFATFNTDVMPLEEHLGHAARLIDRAVEMSPTGRIDLSAGWVKQKFAANWKMLPENDTDGYHVQIVHSSIAKVVNAEYAAVISDPDENIKAEARGWQGGHTELDFAPVYTKRFEWLSVTPDRYPEYISAMAKAYGAERSQQILIAGPPHAIVFPNLFLGEMNIAIIQPINANESVQWHTPMLLEEVPDELNNKLIRQSEAAMGPSALLLADDGIISERQQIALEGESDWLDLSRGMDREIAQGQGGHVGRVSDETTNRSFWHHYRAVMTGT